MSRVSTYFSFPAQPRGCHAVLSHFSPVWLLETSWTVAFQAPLSIGFFRQEYWSGLPCPPPGDLSWPRDQTHVSCIFCIAGGFFTTEPLGGGSTLRFINQSPFLDRIVFELKINLFYPFLLPYYEIFTKLLQCILSYYHSNFKNPRVMIIGKCLSQASLNWTKLFQRFCHCCCDVKEISH